MTGTPRYRLDDLRRFASTLGVGAGVSAERSAALATHLLWFDAAGATSFGIATLASWLDRIEASSVDPAAVGQVVAERVSTVVLDGQSGLPPLILARAAELAMEKARDAGLAMVRVVNLGSCGPAAGVVAEMAIGPVAALVLGPGPSCALAVPSEEGLPAVLDSALGAERLLDQVSPWALALAPEGSWLVAAVGIAALGSLAAFHQRVNVLLQGEEERPGRLLPGPWEARRREAREHGIAINADEWRALERWAKRFGIEAPEPCLD